jgi:tetratricopeptide (TPR) repeat protein
MRLITRFTLFFVVAALALTADARPADSAKSAQARQHYEAGLAAFNLRDFKVAIAEFEAGYRLKPDPVFLYNLGQAHRLAESHDQALYFYRAYLRTSADPPNRKEVEERIATLEKLLAEKKEAARPPDHTLAPGEPKPAPAPPPAPAPAPPTQVTSKTDRKPVYKRWWLWTAVGVGAAAVAVGLGVGLTVGRQTTSPTLGTFGPGALTVEF